MSKKCIVRRNSEGSPEIVLVKNPNISSIKDYTGSELTNIANENATRLSEYIKFRRLQKRADDLIGTNNRLRKSQEEYLKNSEFNDRKKLFLDLGYPTDILKSILNPNLKIQVSMAYLYDHIINRGDSRNIGDNDINEVMRAIHNPIAVYRNKETDSYGNHIERNDRFELLTSLKNKDDKNITFIVESDRLTKGRKDFLGKKIEYNYNTINTAIADKGIFSRLVGVINTNPSDVLFINKERVIKEVQGGPLGGQLLDLTYNDNSDILEYNIDSSNRNYNANIKTISEFSKSFKNKLTTSEVKFHINKINSELPIRTVPGEILKEVQNRLMSIGLIKNLNIESLSNDSIAGYYDKNNNEIYLNINNPNILETSIHEFGHAYLDWLENYYPDHLIAGKTLLDINKTEAQSYINYVKETQPDLDENSDEFKEEVLAQIIGDNGSKLINSKSNNDIIQWLNDLWEMFKNIIGLTNYTAQDIVNMSLQDFANAVNSDMINNNIAKYSISILESLDFKNLKGKQVKKETIKQYLNKQGIKQIEKDIINYVLDQKDFDNKFNYDVFEKAVKLQIMPLSKIDSDTYSDYGADNINLEYDKSKTIVYNTPVNHNINGGYHFTYEHELYKPANTENTEIKIISSDKHFGPVTLLLDKDGVELYRKEGDYSLSAMRAYYGNQYATTKELTQGGFGHTRVWLKDDAYIIAEIQSDIFQKNNIKNDLKGNDLNTKQFIASSKFFELRLIRESIKDAATKGYDKVRIPLPFTLSTIEGYLKNEGQYTVTNDNDIDKEYLEQGDLINYLGETYIIVYSNNNEIKALPYEEAVTSIYTSDDIEQMLRDNGLYDEWYNASTSEKKDIINSMFGDNIVIEDKLTGDFQEVNESGAQTFPQWRKGKNNIATDRLSFRISDLEEFRQPIARRYEKLGDLLKQERGDDNFDIIEDENGYPWYETKIKDSDRNESIKAFQIVPEHILNMKYDDELSNSLNTAVEMKNEEEATDQQIKNETGWEYNKITGVWEYEINNGQFIQEEFYKLQDNSLGKNKTSETDLKNIWEHPELYEIFPDLKKAKITFTDINNIDVNINIGTINENDIDNLITNIEKLSMKSLSDDEYFRLKDLLKSKKGTRLSEEQEQYLENTLDINLRYVIYDILKGHSLMSAVARLIQRNIYEGNMIISKDNILNIVNKELPLLLKEGIFRKNIKITEANAMLSYIDNNPIFKINKNIGIDLANKEMTHEIQHYIQDFFDEGLGGNQYEYPLADIKRRMLEIVDIKIAKSNNSDDIKYLQKKKKEYEKTDPRILRKIYYNNLIGEVQSRMAANRYDYDYEDRKILFSNNIDVNSLDIIDKYIHDNSFIPSQLYENLKNEPFMEEEEALEIYKPMVYSKEASYINSINLNEC